MGENITGTFMYVKGTQNMEFTGVSEGFGFYFAGPPFESRCRLGPLPTLKSNNSAQGHSTSRKSKLWNLDQSMSLLEIPSGLDHE
jgi:hypothetical protein